MENNALYHWGIKGQKWGQRRYQNKDGSLTPAGQKRYNKEVEKLKKETAKVKAAEKLAANNKKVQSKFDKLEEKKAALEARKKALKDGKDPEEEKKKAEEAEKETVEQKRERLLKSTDPKELYDNKDLLTTQELNERINRINTEAQLSSKIVQEKALTGQEKLKEMQSKIDTLTATYRSIDNAYSALTGSKIGKTLAKKLGFDIEPAKEDFDIDKLWAKRNKLSNKEIQDINQRLNNEKSIELELDRRKNKAEKEAKKDNDGGSKKDSRKAEKEAKKAEKEAKAAEKEASQKDKTADKQAKNAKKSHTDDTDGKVYGEGTSHSDIKDRMDNGKKWWDTTGVYETVDFTSDSSTRDRGEAFIFGYLEDRNGR